MPRTRSTTGTGTGTSYARSESHVEEEEDHWRRRMEQQLLAQEELIRDLYDIVGSLSKLKLLPKLFQDGESSRVCDDDHDHEQAQEHSLPVTQEVQSRRSGELKKTAEDLGDFLGKVRAGGSVVNDEILGLAKLFNDLLTRDNISRIKNDDKMIQSEGGVDAFSEDELGENCRERGMLGLRSVEEMRQQHYFKMEVDDEHQSSDPFNNIPSSIIEHILCLVPIKDAVRTSILSRNWRYRWTKIPKLKFYLENMGDEDELEEKLFPDWSSERKELMTTCKQFFAVHQVLSMHRGPVLDFSFEMYEPDDDTFEVCNVEIEQIILQLARTNNNVKKFTFYIARIDEGDYSRYELPRSIFLLRHLTDLHIENCTLDVVPTIDGFGSLTSLFFQSGSFSEKPLLHLLANCPLLKKLELLLEPNSDCSCINIVELFKCLPVIEDLSICQFIVEDSHVPPELPVALVHLKRFRFSDMWFLDTFGLQFLSLVMRSSPNLEKIELKISAYECEFTRNELRSDALKDCSDIWLEHLKELEIRNFGNMQHDMKFVKLILAKAPVLKKLRIVMSDGIERDEKVKIKRIVERSRRVSPLAEIMVLRWVDDWKLLDEWI